jgi:hypothetical protein
LLSESRLPVRNDMITAIPSSDFRKVLAITEEGNRTITPLVLVQNWTRELERR